MGSAGLPQEQVGPPRFERFVQRTFVPVYPHFKRGTGQKAKRLLLISIQKELIQLEENITPKVFKQWKDPMQWTVVDIAFGEGLQG
ncbi:hypothetical protein, partial [Methanoculleus sp. MH98A]|uniref:hypothetical protein n=1 Tax=Methanoculleus sp. MH98A TaxID=1495314 RepID=UPI00064F751F